MTRRELLIQGSRFALGASIVARPRLTSGLRSEATRSSLDSLIAGWEANIDQWLREVRLPSASIAIIQSGKLKWRKAFGVKDSGTNERVDIDTVYAACSNTKPVFAYAVAKLCERGLMGLDTPLVKYLPQPFVDDPRGDLITARHVLTHTTGFPNWRQEPAPLTMEFTPGERFQYSGEGFSYLQAVVTRVTGQPFEVFMRENVFRPFGMTSSRVTWDVAFARRLAKPHDSFGVRLPEKFFELPTAEARSRDLTRYGAAASLLTTPTDYAKFVLEILNPKPADRFRLNAETRRELLRPQVIKQDGGWESLGWALAQVPLPGIALQFLHAGQDAGYYCFCNASEQTKSAIIMMTNGDNFPAFQEKAIADPVAFLTAMFGVSA